MKVSDPFNNIIDYGTTVLTATKYSLSSPAFFESSVSGFVQNIAEFKRVRGALTQHTVARWVMHELQGAGTVTRCVMLLHMHHIPSKAHVASRLSLFASLSEREIASARVIDCRPRVGGPPARAR